MGDKENILSGRNVVDAYRASHIRLPKEHALHTTLHTTLQDALTADLGKLGFESIESFFTANRLLNQATLISSIAQVSECDRCVGTEKEGSCFCYTFNMEEIGQPPHVGGHSGRGLLGLVNLWPKHWRPHIPLKMGDIFSFFPGCHINIKVIEEPEIDWEWQ